MHSFLFHMKDTYCGIIFIRAGQYPLVAKIFLVRGDEVSLVASEYETYACLYLRGDVNSSARVIKWKNGPPRTMMFPQFNWEDPI